MFFHVIISIIISIQNLKFVLFKMHSMYKIFYYLKKLLKYIKNSFK
jgi:hypothetical protein